MHHVRLAHRCPASPQLFSLRVDPMIDGLNNQIVQVDAVPDSAPVGSSSNYYGNGFYNKKTLYKTTKEAVADYDGRSGRIWSIENPNKKNAYSGNNVGYKMGELRCSSGTGKLDADTMAFCRCDRSVHADATLVVPRRLDGLETSSLGETQREFPRLTSLRARIHTDIPTTLPPCPFHLDADVRYPLRRGPTLPLRRSHQPTPGR